MKMNISSSPHITSSATTRRVMLDVIIALMFPLIGGVCAFGARALLVALVSVAAAVVAEFAWDKLTKKPNTVSDLSAVVTGLLLAFCCPVGIPLWMVVIGDVFAIIIAKQCFGGIGKNFINPALAARAFMLASFPAAMTAWKVTSGIAKGWDAVSSATPLAAPGGEYSYTELLLGKTPGCIGEVSAILILVGALYLVVRRVIDIKTPVAYLLSIAVFTWIFGGEGFFAGDPLYAVLSGGVMLGACFMATDYTTSPISGKGRIVFGIGCGVINGIIRIYGNYPEGVTYAIMVMNALVPFIDKFTLPKKFGTEAAK